MGVEECKAFAEDDVLLNEGLEEGGLANTGLAEQVHVVPTVGLLDAEDLPFGPEGGGGEAGDVVVHPGRMRDGGVER